MSAVAGAVLGLLGHQIRTAAGHGRTIAAGLATGLLGAQAGALAIKLSGWASLDGPGWSLLIAAIVTVGLAFIVPAAMLGRTSSWPVYLMSVVVAAGLATAAWSLLDGLRSTI